MKVIYLHKNKINGKVYIGQTIQNVEERWKNGKAYKSCTRFNNAINKYGWDNFEHIILEQGDWDQKTLDEKEQYYINLYQAKNPKYGYNIKDGGNKGISPNALSQALLWMEQHPEFGKARAQDMLKWQKEHPEEALAMRMENVKKASEARKRKVLCIETNQIFESASDAARKVPKTTQSKICMACRGQRKTCGGFHWRYIDNEN